MKVAGHIDGMVVELYLTPGHRFRHQLIATERETEVVISVPWVILRRCAPAGNKSSSSLDFILPSYLLPNHVLHTTTINMSSKSINHAGYLGIHSEGAAILFAALYAVCLPYYIFRSWNNRTYVLIFLAIFCLRTSHSSSPSSQLRSDILVLSVVRVITFAMRAALATNSGDNINLLVTELVFYGIGFFGLLLSAFILVNNRFVLLF
jgi:hypothetical protein